MKKWSEKNKLEKAADIVAAIAFCAWMVFNIIDRVNNTDQMLMASTISIVVGCACEAISCWRVKRSLSYICIGGAAFAAITVIVGAILLAQ